MNGDPACLFPAESELAVLSSISVREEYKSRLKALLEVMMSVPVVKNREHRSNRLLARKISTNSGTGSIQKMAADIPQKKQMCVLGDWLLLLRAASVNVVECIQSWRQNVHHGRPQPFLFGGINYVQAMCDDTDFLDENNDLVEWLGFRLHRNPFIIHEALDDKISQDVGEIVHAARSGKYWSSADWQRRKQPLSKNDPTKVFSKPDEKPILVKTKAQWRIVSPPLALIKPLSSIVPEDNDVDGSRIEAAQRVVLDEEALHGRASGLNAINRYLDDSSRLPDERIAVAHEQDKGIGALYEKLAAVTAQIQTTQLQYSRCNREKARAQLAIQDLKHQVQWTQKSIERDFTHDHAVWKLREHLRQGTMRVYKSTETRLLKRLVQLDNELMHLKDTTERQQDQIRSLRREKENERTAKHEKMKREEQERQNLIRKKIAVRSNAFKPKRDMRLKKSFGKSSASENSSHHDSANNDAPNHNEDFEVTLLRSMPLPNRCDELENKRHLSIQQKENAQRNRNQIRLLMTTEKEQRRAESAMMRLEDNLARALENQYRAKSRLRELRAHHERIAATSIFSCAHEMSGKKFRISIYEHFAQGYLPDGIRIVAYDPVSSVAFPLVISKREYSSLGFGKTPEGLRDFCKWLSLLYERRKKQFRLIWSGSACPPPLRVRELDSTLLCVHKEGLKMLSFYPKYVLASVHVRSNDCSKIHFVMSAIRNQEIFLVERTVKSSQLFQTDAFKVRQEKFGQACIAWRHQENSEMPSTHSRNNGSRVFSGDVVVECTPMSVHVYDATPTEYILELRPRKTSTCSEMPMVQAQKMVLLKRSVNPYSVRLPASAFHDLVASIRYEKRELVKGDTDITEYELMPVVGIHWIKTLAKYVRVVLLTKFGCKIDGQFSFVKMFIVQQKTEYRSHLLIEFTWVSSSFEKECTRQSVRVSLSDYLRCADAMRHILYDFNFEFESCLQCHGNQHRVDIPNYALNAEWGLVSHRNCPLSTTMNASRLQGLQNLFSIGSISLEMLDWLYQGMCGSCNVAMEPMLLVLCNVNRTENENWIQFLSHYFRCYDIGHTSTLETSEAQTLSDLLVTERIVVIYNANFGPTVSATNAFIHNLHWALYPDHHELPIQIVLLTGDCATRLYELESASFDQHLFDEMRGLAFSIHLVGEMESASVDPDAMKFEAYLESEALLVEVVRIVREPNEEWRKPGETVGASSWTSAISFLTEPLQLQHDLNQSMPSAIASESIKDLMQLYTAHPKWPHGFGDVRTAFHALLAFILRFVCVQQLLEGYGGLLTKTSNLYSSSEAESCNLLQDAQMIQLRQHISS